MTRKPTQTERVIVAARSFQGVNQVDFLGPNTIDGGPPITRLAARLWDAEQQGYSFECIGWREKCKTWRLVSEPEAVEQAVSAPSGGGEDRVSSSIRSAAGSLLSSPDTLFDVEHESLPHWRGEAA